MKSSNIIIIALILILCAAVVVAVWNLDGKTSSPPPEASTSSQAAPEKEDQAKASETPDKPSEEKGEAEKASEKKEEKKADEAKTEKTDTKDDDQLEAINLKEVEMKQLIPKIAEWTGKVIIPHDEALKQKLTIYAEHEVPRAQALELIWSALQAKGFIAEQTGNIIYLKPIKEARLSLVPTLSANEPLAQIEDKSQMVQKFFRLKNYSPTRLQQIVLPLIAEHGYITADESTRNLVVIDSVANLLRIQYIIDQLDVPESEETVTRTFTIAQGDPVEIVDVLRLLLKKPRGKSDKSDKSDAKPSSSDKESPATSVVIGPSEQRIVLIPETKRNWIIAMATADDMGQIEMWIEKLDQKQPIQREYSLKKIEYVDVREVADQINRMIQDMPGRELKSNVVVQPLAQAKQIMIVGSEENRIMVEKLIAEIDIPTDRFLTEHFQLEFADPELIKKNLDDLYSEFSSTQYSNSWGSGRYTRYHSSGPDNPDMVRVIAYTTLKQVTVIASADNLEKIRQQIKEWDKPIDVSEVAPLIIELKNSDPVKIANLLSGLFTEMTQGERGWDYWYFHRGNDDQKKIVGPLYGKLTFEAVPETKKIIVISKVPEAYAVIKELIIKLDQQEPAELPMVVTLKYADCEDLCEQLNAILNETGTLSPFQRSQRGLSEVTADTESNEQTTRTRNQNNQQQQKVTDMVTPWWNRARQRINEEMPTSNIVGKIRFIPVYRSKAILVLSASEYQKNIREMIESLDKPAKQVLVKVVLLDVSHESMTSLGVRLTSSPNAFNLGENALRFLNDLVYAETFGHASLSSSLNVSALVDLLVQETDAKILNQPSIWTKDNEEAYFFKGRSVPFIESSQSSSEGTSIRQGVVYRNVGVTLRVRPNITPEKAVDTTINLMVSDLLPETIEGNIITTLLDNTTHLIVNDGQTIILSGILFHRDRDIEKKVPLLGDLPLLGMLFKHTETVQTNSELLAFITPYVFDENATDQSKAQLDTAIETMKTTQDQLGKIVNKNQESKEEE